MAKKIASLILIVAAALSITGCLYDDSVCAGSGSCYDPEFCCDLFGDLGECYYYAEGHTYWCSDSTCSDAEYDLAWDCGY